MKPIRLLLIGCTGRMGGRLISLAAASHFELVGAVSEPGHEAIGRDAAVVHGGEPVGIAVTDDFDGDCDVVIEFSTPAGCTRWAGWCRRNACPLVSGTTGLDAGQESVLRAAAERTAVFWSPNMSIGANLLMHLSAEVAAALGREVEIEISETHHRGKIDAPSGTARALVAAVCGPLGRDPQRVAVYGRAGQCGPRKPTEIGVHSLRIGDVVGEHEIQFRAGAETLRLRHEAHSRDAFAAGALRAAGWLLGRAKGFYGMSDLLRDRS